jgi:hypothetical protein
MLPSVPDPDVKILANHVSDYVKPGNIPRISAIEAFEKYVRQLWELLVVAQQKGEETATSTFDCILHRAAYLFVEADAEKISLASYQFQTPQMFIGAARRSKGKAYFGTKLLRMLAEIYLSEGYGWHKGLLNNEATWSAETRRFAEPWVALFPSWHHQIKANVKAGEALGRRTPTETLAKKKGEEAMVFIEGRQKLEENVSAHSPVISKIRAAVGEQRFDF